MQRVAHERVCKLFEHQVPSGPRLVHHTDSSGSELTHRRYCMGLVESTLSREDSKR